MSGPLGTLTKTALLHRHQHYRRLAPLHVAALVLWGFLICGASSQLQRVASPILFPTFDVTASRLERVVVAPLMEETAKALGVLWAFAFLPRRSWSAGFLYASLVGVGFGVSENIIYYDRAGFSWAMADVRVPGTYMHSVFNSCFGVLLGLTWASGAWARLGLGVLGLLIAVLLHGSSNTVTTAAAIDVSGLGAAVAWLVTLFIIGRRERKPIGP